jgi:putative ABC transport system substrate-binding protein
MRGVELIVAVGNDSIKAAKDTSTRIPIVMGYAGEDPVAAGFAASLAQPGGNVSGVITEGSGPHAKYHNRFGYRQERIPSPRH